MKAWSGLLILVAGTAACAGSEDHPVVGDEARAALEALSPEKLPAPPRDVSNRYADDPKAAAFGHRLFFDKLFSGRLLDSDNSGDQHSLGAKGESGKVACAGCHVPEAGFVDVRSVGQQVSLAAGWGHRKTRSLLDIGQAKVLMWDGLHDALYNQPFQPIESATEMNSSRLFVAQQVYVRHRAEYESIFGPIPIALDDEATFPKLDGGSTGCRSLSRENEGVDCHGMPGDGAEFDGLGEHDQREVTRIVVNLGKALGAYERLLTCGPSRFDAWMHGDRDALSPAEQRGAALFVGQGRAGRLGTGCNSCHTGPFFTSQEFHNVGLRPAGVGPARSFYDTDDHGALDGLTRVLADPLNVRGEFSDGDDGRLPDSVPRSTDGAFRTPSLRCVSRRPTFMHTGQLLQLSDVVAFFSRGGDDEGYPGKQEITARNFTDEEASDLVAFLMALDGPGPRRSLLAPP